MFHVQKKPDYIPKEDILKELQQIDDNLNKLEKEGVQLELRLRRCEEGEGSASASLINEGLVVEKGSRARKGVCSMICVCVCVRRKR